MITFWVEDKEGQTKRVEAPEDMGFSLMEILKASGYPIQATCGGMALCATCHVEVLEGFDDLPEPGDAELDMLDTVPNAVPDSRLACQLRLTPDMEGMKFKLLGEQDD